MFQYSDGKTYLWTLQKKASYQFDCSDIDGMEAEAMKRNRQREDCYFSVGLMERTINVHERARNEDIIAIPALWADIDIANPVHAADNLPPDYSAARSLLPGALDPTCIVFSGYGIHVYYQLREPLETRTQEERAQADDLLRRLQGIIRKNAAARGWHLDSVPDICRVLRVPGTYNYKNGSDNAVQCVVAEYDESKLYNVDDFDILPPVEEKNDSGRREKFDRRETDAPASLMMENCMFLQYWQQNCRTLPEPVWKAACTNIIRGVDGENIILGAAKAWLGDKFNESQTMKKLHHYLNECTPQTCQHIHEQIGYTGCHECTGIKSPCSWSLGKVPQAVARIRRIALPDSDNTFNPETLGDLALLKKYNSLEYAKFEERCKSRVNINNLKHEVKKAQASAAGLSVVNGGNGAQETVSTGNLMTTCQTVPDTPLNLLVPGQFSFLPNGIYKKQLTQDGNSIPKLVSGNPLIISLRTYNLDTGIEKVQLSFKSFNRWVSRMCKRSEVFTSRNIVSLADLGLNISSETAKNAVMYLQEFENINHSQIPLTYAVSKIGWRENSISEFVIPSQSQYSVDIDDDGEVTEAFETAGDYAEWIKTAQEVRKYPFARFVISASFAAPLLKIFKNRNFMIFFWGTSGGGKTASQVFALSAWGRPSKMMKSFYGTTNGIERAAEYSNDFPLVINEKQVMSGSNKQENLESLVYMLEGGHGKQRASRSGIRRTATWRTIAMASGEEPLSKDSSIQGVKTRLLEINTSSVLENNLAKQVYGFTEENHGTAGPVFVKRLLQDAQSQYHEIIEARNALVKRLSADYPENFSIHIDNIATTCIADYLVSIWLFGDDPHDAQQAAYDLGVAVLDKMPTQQEISDVSRGWNYFSTWMLSNKQRFSTDMSYTKLVPEYGYVREGFYNIYPSYVMDAMDAAGFSSTKLLREFADAGLIESVVEGGKRRFKIQVHRDGRKIRVIRVQQFEGVPTEK